MVHSFPHLACWSGCRPLPLVSTVLADYFSAVMRVISSCQEFGPGLVWAFMQIPAKRMKYDTEKKTVWEIDWAWRIKRKKKNIFFYQTANLRLQISWESPIMLSSIAVIVKQTAELRCPRRREINGSKHPWNGIFVNCKWTTEMSQHGAAVCLNAGWGGGPGGPATIARVFTPPFSTPYRHHEMACNVIKVISGWHTNK